MATPYPSNVRNYVGQGSESLPVVRTLQFADLGIALRRGLDDFKAVPSHAIMLCLIYPIAGLVLARLVMGYAVLPLLFPLAAGFALLGPFAAVGLYELSCRREQGLDLSATHAFNVLRSPSFGAMLGVGTLLLASFVVWVATAQAIYISYFGYQAAADIPDFLNRIFTTREGWSLIIVGCGVGFLFALGALCLTVVAFPMMLDRHASAADAMLTSLRVTARNPIVVAAWGLIVAALLVIGSIPAFLGLAVVVPVLGHASWHLYRRAVDTGMAHTHERPREVRGRRYVAEFPASLFARSRKE